MSTSFALIVKECLGGFQRKENISSSWVFLFSFCANVDETMNERGRGSERGLPSADASLQDMLDVWDAWRRVWNAVLGSVYGNVYWESAGLPWKNWFSLAEKINVMRFHFAKFIFKCIILRCLPFLKCYFSQSCTRKLISADGPQSQTSVSTGRFPFGLVRKSC